MKYRVCIETRAIRDIEAACGWICAALVSRVSGAESARQALFQERPELG